MSANTITQEVALPFGKELAANEKKTRDKAVRSLRKFISTGPSLSKLDLLKLWKGLFYCFWMSDKPLVQQALAEDLASLVQDIPSENVIPFLEAFWEIHCAEWHGLDRIRLDKYYMLFRKVIFYTFLYLANQDWNSEKMEEYNQMLLRVPLNPTDRTKPDAIKYFLIDIYFEELQKILELQVEQGEEIHLNEEQAEEPFRVLASSCMNKTVRKKAKEMLESRQEESEEDEQDEDEGMSQDEE